MACLPLCKNAQSRVEMTAPSRFGPSLLPAPQIVKQPEVDGDSLQVGYTFHFLASDRDALLNLQKRMKTPGILEII